MFSHGITLLLHGFLRGAENCLMNSIRQPSAWRLSLHANDSVPARCISTGQDAINTLKYIEATTVKHSLTLERVDFVCLLAK